MKKYKIIFTDLDGTLLDNESRLSKNNREMLNLLQEKNIIRVISTGRSLFSANKVLAEDFPIDYLVFSSGAAIIDWKTKQILFKESIPIQEYRAVIELLKTNHLDFMIHKEIPNNHAFYYWSKSDSNPDFQKRIEYYKSHSSPYREEAVFDHEITQFVVIFQPEQLGLFHTIRNQISALKTIRTTSPLDHRSIWLEIFPKHISKGHAAEWLCRKLHINRSQTVSIGNDYNDIDMLRWTKRSFVVENAPADLKKEFQRTRSNQEDGFASVMKLLFQEAD